MARYFQLSVWGLALLALVAVNLTPDCGAFTPEQAADAAQEKATQKLTGDAVKFLTQDLYDKLMRKGLTQGLRRGLHRIGQSISSSPFRRLAHAWHEMLGNRLRTAKIPESWKTTAVELHKKLGGEGDLLAALPNQDVKGGVLNLKGSFLREEFISLALFFLNVFVPQQISKCVNEPDNLATSCIAQYEQPLQAALISTLSAFFHFVISQSSASRVLSQFFVSAAGSPCPFGFLMEPVFVYGALLGSDVELLKPLSSVKREASAKACPDLKMTLLNVLMLNGVTPADMMKAKSMKEELGKFPNSRKNAIVAEKESIMEAGEFDQKLKEGDTATAITMEDAAQLLTDLMSHLGTLHPKGEKGFRDSPLGAKVTGNLASKRGSAGLGYLQRAKEILGIQKNSMPDVGGFKMSDLLKELSDVLQPDAQEAQKRVPLYPVKAESLDDVAKAVLDQLKNFGPKGVYFLQPAKDGGKE